MTDIDFIGDTHGHADKLEELLLKLEYRRHKKGFRHHARKVIFVGDYIDRGPDNLNVVKIVRSMVDSGDAIALCGNHEHNAICFNTKIEGGYLRDHSIKNFKQHAETLLQYLGRQSDYDDTIEWFKSLPLYYETPAFRVVHATWDDNAIEDLRSYTIDGVLSDEQYHQLTDDTTPLYNGVEVTCKGKETLLPDGISFFDEDRTERFEIRTKWWLDPKTTTIKDLSIIDNLGLRDEIVNVRNDSFYDRENICCLDYSIAKGGNLCAYRYNGEDRLSNNNFIFV